MLLRLKLSCVIAVVAFGSWPVHAGNEVVLSAGGFEITENDFWMYLDERQVPEERRQDMLSRNGAVRDIFENLYVIKAYASKAEGNSALDWDEIRWLVDNYRDRLLMERQLNTEVDAAMAGYDVNSAAREEYTARVKEFALPERLNASHVLIGSSTRSTEEALVLAEEVLAKARAGEDFAALAETYSDDAGSKGRGGSVGVFGRGQMVAPFEEAAFALQQDGDISEPVETEFGYHIIRLNERIAARTPSFEEMSAELAADIERRRRSAIRNGLITDMRNGQIDLGLEVNVEVLRALEAQFAPVETEASDNPPL